MSVWILRSALSVLLGFAVFLALMLFLFFTVGKGLMDDDIYVEALEERGFYERFYSEALTSEFIEELLKNITGNSTILSLEELPGLIQTVAPPDYLKGQVEANLLLLASFSSGNSDTLELHLELNELLEGLVPSMVNLVARRIEGAPVLPPAQLTILAAGSSHDKYTAEITTALETLLAGKQVSTSISDLTGLSENELLDIFDRSVEEILENPAVDQRYRDSLREAESELRQTFVSGNTRDFLTQAAKTAAVPAIDAALAEFRSELDDQGRLDLVPLLAEEVFDVDENELQNRAQRWRDRVLNFLNWTRNISIGILVLATAIMLSIYWKSMGGFLKWLCWTLMLSGATALALLALAYLVLPGIVERQLQGQLLDILPEFSGTGVLAGEVAVSIALNQLKSLIWIAAAPLVAGAILWTVSPVLSRLIAGAEDPPGRAYQED